MQAPASSELTIEVPHPAVASEVPSFWVRCKLPQGEASYLQFPLSSTSVSQVKEKFLAIYNESADEEDFVVKLRGGPVLLDSLPFAEPPAHEIIAEALRRGGTIGLRLYYRDELDEVKEVLSPSVRRLIVPFSFREWQQVIVAQQRREEIERKRAEHEIEQARAEWRKQLEEAKLRREQADRAVRERAEAEKRQKRDDMDRKREALIERRKHLQAQRAAMSPERVPTAAKAPEPITPATTPLRRSNESRKDNRVLHTSASPPGSPPPRMAVPRRPQTPDEEEEEVIIDEDDIVKRPPATVQFTPSAMVQKKSGSFISSNAISKPSASRLANNRTVSSGAIIPIVNPSAATDAEKGKGLQPLPVATRKLSHSTSIPTIPVLDVFEEEVQRMLQLEEKQKVRAKARKQKSVSKHPPGRTIQLVIGSAQNLSATPLTVTISKNTIQDFHQTIKSATTTASSSGSISALYEEPGAISLIDDDDVALIPPGAVVRVIFAEQQSHPAVPPEG